MKDTTKKAHVAKARITRDPIAAKWRFYIGKKDPELNEKRVEIWRLGSAHSKTKITKLLI